MEKSAPKVLIIDDDDYCLDILEEVLVDDYHLYRAKSGEEALLLMPTINPVLILLDVNMENINGYETCRHIRKSEHLKNTKIIMLTASAMNGDKVMGIEAGADAYLTKPIDFDILLNTVRRYVTV